MTVLRYTFYPVALALAGWILISAAQAERYMNAAAAMQSPEASAERVWRSVLESLSLSFYDGAREQRGAYAGITEQARTWQKKSQLFALVVAAAAALQIFWMRFSSGISRNVFARHLNMISMIGFGVGIAAPMMMVSAFADIPVVGNVVFRFESKSILSTICALIHAGNIVLALLIAIFSVVLPLAKMLLLTIGLSGHFPSARERIRGWLHAIGKWSMADVFAVAVLVAYLASNTDAYSRADVGIGFYFFTAYCLLSLWAAQALLTER